MTHLRVNNEDLITILCDSDEGVDDVCAHVHGYVLDAVAAHSWPVHRPVAEVAYYARFAVRCAKKMEELELEAMWLFSSELVKVTFIVSICLVLFQAFRIDFDEFYYDKWHNLGANKSISQIRGHLY